jgi:hypothetical protein
VKATSTTGRAKGSKPRAGRKVATAKSTPVEDVVSVDITADVVDVTDIVDDVDPLTDLVARTKEDASPSYSRRPLACVSFGGGMIADARVLSAFHRLTTGTFTNALEG